MAISDPWSNMAMGACIPLPPSIGSYKKFSYARFSGAIGTQGFGFIQVSPSLLKDNPSFFYTTASFTKNDSDNMTQAVTGVTRGYMTTNDLTYAQAASGGNNVGRIVSIGVKMRYTGTVLNQSGQFYGYVSPNHQSFTGQTSDNLAARRECVIANVLDQQELMLVDCPSRDVENQYTAGDLLGVGTASTVAPYSTTILGGSTLPANGTFPLNGTAGYPTMIIMITGVAGQSFYGEVVQHNEYVGDQFTQMLTPSHNDFTGYEIVNMASKGLSTRQSINPKKTPRNLMLEGLKDAAKSVVPVAITALTGNSGLGAIATAALASF